MTKRHLQERLPHVTLNIEQYNTALIITLTHQKLLPTVCQKTLHHWGLELGAWLQIFSRLGPHRIRA
jgi:hypothetical protein